MKKPIVALASLLLAGTLALGYALQDEGGMMPESAGPEHEVFRHFIGTWDAAVDMGGQKSKGIYTLEIGPGGMWCIGDFESQMMGDAFKGHDIMGYDAEKKVYTTVWVDSMTSKMAIGEGRWDARTKTLTFDMPGKNFMTGEPWIEKHITTFPTPDTMSFKMEAPGEDGKPTVVMSVEYTRKK